MPTTLAQKIHAQTNCGRDVIDFFASIAHSDDPDMKAFHRNRAIRTLLGRGWGKAPRIVKPDCDSCDDETHNHEPASHAGPGQSDETPTAHTASDQHSDSTQPAAGDQSQADDDRPTLTQQMASKRAQIEAVYESSDPEDQTQSAGRQPTLSQQMASKRTQIEAMYDSPDPEDQPLTANQQPTVTTRLHPLARYVRSVTDDGQTLITALVEIQDSTFENATDYDRSTAGLMILDRAHGTDYTAEILMQIESPAAPSDTKRSDVHPDSADDVAARIREAILPIMERARLESGWTPGSISETDDPSHIPDYSMWDQIHYDPADIEAYVEEYTPIIEAERVERRARYQKYLENRKRREAEEQAANNPETRNTADPPEDPGADDNSADGAPELPDRGPPLSRDEHESFFHPTAKYWLLENCRHPDCRLHDEPIRYPEDSESYDDYMIRMGRYL